MIEFREEQEQDYEAIGALIVEVFHETYGTGKEEARLVDELRKMDGFEPSLSIVAVDGDEIVGHVMFSKVEIVTTDRHIPALALAPLGVKKTYRGQGIGAQLTRLGLDKGRELAYAAVFVQGDPAYYGRFGFVPASSRGLTIPFSDVPDPVNQVLELGPDTLNGISGTVEYPQPWDPFK
jgi:putative acetyltransferase